MKNLYSSLMPGPRSFAGTALLARGLTALPFGILWSISFAYMSQRPLYDILPLGLVGGFLFGLIFGISMGILFRGEKVAIEFLDKQTHMAGLNIGISEPGYYPVTQFDDFFAYKPSIQAGLAAGRICVQLVDNEAVILGPKFYVKKLADRLRN